MEVFIFGRRRFGGAELIAGPLGLPHGFDVGPEAGESSGNFLVASGKVLVQQLFAGCQSLVKVQSLDLQCEAALDIFEAEIARGGMSWFHNVKEVGVGVSGKEGK